MSQDYNNGYNLDNLKKLLNFKGVVKKDNLDEKLVKIFNFFDANHNGQLESNELTQILNQVTQYGASRNKSIFDKQEATSFVNSYKNAQNKTLKQLGVNADNLYQFLDKVKNNVNKQTINRKITMNLEVTGLNTYRELAQWLFRQEGKKPNESELQKRTNELINLNKNSNPPIQNGKLKGNYVKISISQKGINNVSKYITKQAFKAISGMNWNASGIKKIQKMFDKGEINRYDIVEFLDNFNHKKDKEGNVISETQQGDTSIIDAIISETEWGNNSNKIKLLTSIIENAYWAAIDAGVPKATVSKLTAEYKKEMNKQMKFFEGTGIASADAQGMENALNSLIGQIKVARLGVKTKTDYSRAERFAQDNKSAVTGDITNNNAIQTAKEFYNIVDNNSGSTSMQKLKALVYNPKKFNYKNVVDVITAYNQTGIRQGDADIIDSILSESHTNKTPTINQQNKTYIANGEAYDVINKILNTLKQSAKEKGVPDRFLTEARTEWAKEMYKLKVSKTSKLEENEVHMKYINKLIDLIGGKNVGATGAYADGRASDSWVGMGADKVFGLFGCKTMSEMEAKLGNQAQNAKDLINIANHIKSAKTNAEKAKFMQQFKVKYKAIFGVDYNPQVMSAREELQDKIAQVQINKSLQPVFNKALGAKDISSMKKAIEDCKIVMGKDDKTKKNIYLADIINMQVEAYMQAKAPQGLMLSNPNEYNKMYSEIYKNIVSNMKAEYQKTAKEAIGNSSYEQMQIDMEQLNQAAYGTTNIGKEVAKFNQNQAMTQQYSELALDIGATIATCWIPGLGEAAGLKMVATFGKLAQSATKMAKFYKALETAGKTLYKGSKFVKGIQTTSAIGKMEQVGDKTVRTIKVGQKTVQLGKVANFALESAVSGAYNMINTGATITTLHGLEHLNKNQNWKANWEAGKGMAIFGGVSAVGGFAGKVTAQIASKMGISLEIAQKSLAFVVSEGANFGYANAETVMAYIKEKQKTDPSFNFSKMSTKELWEVICSDENLINNVIMATMTTVTHITQGMTSKAGRDNLIDNITETKFENKNFDGKDPITKNEHPTNLTNELERAWYSNNELKTLLHNNPNLKRSVGALPQKWGRDIGTKNGFEKVDNIFYEFSSSIYENFSGENINNQLNIMQNKLSQVLGKNVEIKYLGKGNVGFTFTVEVDGQKFVLKTYNKNSDFLNNNIRHQENQGNYAELKSAVYASKHDKNHFAMFYMGRFGETNEGYMLTKFVEHKEMTKSNKVNNMPITDYRNIAFEQHFEKRLASGDIKSDNVFGKTIIDYGAVYTSIADNLNAKELKLAQTISKALDNNLEGEINNIVLKYGNTKEFKNVVLALKEIIDETCNKNNYKILQTKKAMLDKLGLDTKPDLKYLLETGCFDAHRVHNYTEMYKFTEDELIQMQKQYNEKHKVTKKNTPSANVQMHVPTVLKEFKDRGFVPLKIFNKILNTSDMDVNAKASCLKYIEQKAKSCTDKFTKIIEIRRAMKTINQILNNSNIDKRCISAILGSYKEKTLLQNYEKLSQYKLEPMTRYTLALMDNVSANNVQKYSEFIDAILKRIDNTPDNCLEIAYFIKGSEGKNFDITKLTEYVKSVDKNKLIEMAPSIKEYSAKQYINFLNFHRQKGVVNFDKKALTLGENLTEFLEENPIMYSSGTHELLTAYPLTNTRVGSMPKYFNVKDVESNKIFKATEQLANNLELSRFKTVDTNFEQSLLNQYKSTLQSIIKKEITISEIGNGSFGKVYKLSIEGEKPIAIKLFFKGKGDERSGSDVEIPLAIFTNKHFPEHFAKFYFGKIPSNSGENGFMVSEFLTPSPEGKFPVQYDKKWSFSYDDASKDNIIGGKICDFGYVRINDKENNTTSVSLKLFEY